MTTLDFFTEWNTISAEAVNMVADLFPCFVETTPVEMGWMEINIKARNEDMPTIEILLAGIV